MKHQKIKARMARIKNFFCYPLTKNFSSIIISTLFLFSQLNTGFAQMPPVAPTSEQQIQEQAQEIPVEEAQAQLEPVQEPTYEAPTLEPSQDFLSEESPLSPVDEKLGVEFEKFEKRAETPIVEQIKDTGYKIPIAGWPVVKPFAVTLPTDLPDSDRVNETLTNFYGTPGANPRLDEAVSTEPGVWSVTLSFIQADIRYKGGSVVPSTGEVLYTDKITLKEIDGKIVVVDKKTTSRTGIEARTFDKNGHELSLQRINNDGAVTYATQSEYNDQGLPTHYTMWSFADGKMAFGADTQTEYDASGQVNFQYSAYFYPDKKDFSISVGKQQWSIGLSAGKITLYKSIADPYTQLLSTDEFASTADLEKVLGEFVQSHGLPKNLINLAAEAPSFSVVTARAPAALPALQVPPPWSAKVSPEEGAFYASIFGAGAVPTAYYTHQELGFFAMDFYDADGNFVGRAQNPGEQVSLGDLSVEWFNSNGSRIARIPATAPPIAGLIFQAVPSRMEVRDEKRFYKVVDFYDEGGKFLGSAKLPTQVDLSDPSVEWYNGAGIKKIPPALPREITTVKDLKTYLAGVDTFLGLEGKALDEARLDFFRMYPDAAIALLQSSQRRGFLEFLNMSFPDFEIKTGQDVAAHIQTLKTSFKGITDILFLTGEVPEAWQKMLKRMATKWGATTLVDDVFRSLIDETLNLQDLEARGLIQVAWSEEPKKKPLPLKIKIMPLPLVEPKAITNQNELDQFIATLDSYLTALDNALTIYIDISESKPGPKPLFGRVVEREQTLMPERMKKMTVRPYGWEEMQQYQSNLAHYNVIAARLRDLFQRDVISKKAVRSGAILFPKAPQAPFGIKPRSRIREIPTETEIPTDADVTQALASLTALGPELRGLSLQEIQSRLQNELAGIQSFADFEARELTEAENTQNGELNQTLNFIAILLRVQEQMFAPAPGPAPGAQPLAPPWIAELFPPTLAPPGIAELFLQPLVPPRIHLAGRPEDLPNDHPVVVGFLAAIGLPGNFLDTNPGFTGAFKRHAARLHLLNELGVRALDPDEVTLLLNLFNPREVGVYMLAGVDMDIDPDSPYIGSHQMTITGGFRYMRQYHVGRQETFDRLKTITDLRTQGKELSQDLIKFLSANATIARYEVEAGPAIGAQALVNVQALVSPPPTTAARARDAQANLMRLSEEGLRIQRLLDNARLSQEYARTGQSAEVTNLEQQVAQWVEDFKSASAPIATIRQDILNLMKQGEYDRAEELIGILGLPSMRNVSEAQYKLRELRENESMTLNFINMGAGDTGLNEIRLQMFRDTIRIVEQQVASLKVPATPAKAIFVMDNVQQSLKNLNDERTQLYRLSIYLRATHKDITVISDPITQVRNRFTQINEAARFLEDHMRTIQEKEGVLQGIPELQSQLKEATTDEEKDLINQEINLQKQLSTHYDEKSGIQWLMAQASAEGEDTQALLGELVQVNASINTTKTQVLQLRGRIAGIRKMNDYVTQLSAYIQNALEQQGLTGNDLKVALTTKFKANLAAMVEVGLITQEQADNFLQMQVRALAPPPLPGLRVPLPSLEIPNEKLEGFLNALFGVAVAGFYPHQEEGFYAYDFYDAAGNFIGRAQNPDTWVSFDAPSVVWLDPEGNILTPPPFLEEVEAIQARIAALEEAASAKLKEYEDLTTPMTAPDYEAVRNLLIQLQNDLTNELTALTNELTALNQALVYGYAQVVEMRAPGKPYFYDNLPIYFQSPGYEALADRARALLMSGYLAWEAQKKQVYEAYTVQFNALADELAAEYNRIDQESQTAWGELQAQLAGKTELTLAEYKELNDFIASWDARYAQAAQDYSAKQDKLKAKMNEAVSQILLSPEADAAYNDAYSIARTRESYQRKDIFLYRREEWAEPVACTIIREPIEIKKIRLPPPQFSSEELYKVTPVQKEIADAVEALIASKTLVIVVGGQEVRLNLSNLVNVINEEAKAAYTLRLPGITKEDFTVLGTPLKFDLAAGRALALHLVERYGQTVILYGTVNEEAFRARLLGQEGLAPQPVIPAEFATADSVQAFLEEVNTFLTDLTDRGFQEEELPQARINFFRMNTEAAMLILASPHRNLLFTALNGPLPTPPAITSGLDLVTYTEALKTHLSDFATTLGLAPASADLDRVLVSSFKSTLDLGDLQARGMIRVDVDTDSFLSITLLPTALLAAPNSITTPEGVTAALEALDAYLEAMKKPSVIEVSLTGTRPTIEQEEPPITVFVQGIGLIDPDVYLTQLNTKADEIRLTLPPEPAEPTPPPPTPADVAVDAAQDAVTAGPTGVVFNVASAIASRIAAPPSSEIPAPQESFTQRVSRQSDSIRNKIRAMSDRREQEREKRRRQQKARTATILG